MFCLDYYPHSAYLKDADQLKIKYRPTDKTLKDFLEAYSDKSIVIDVSDNFDDIDAKLFCGLREIFKNFKLIIRYQNGEHLERVQKYGLPFFFMNFATTIDQVYGFKSYNPTDIYICEELGFFLDKIHKILHNEDTNINIRVFPNICQSSFPETPSIQTFFIRPDDIPAYEDLVDVFELVSDRERQAVIFKVYKQHKWFGEVGEIIPTFKGHLDGRFLLNDFGVFRSHCGRRCMYKPGSCNICTRMIELGDTIKDKGYVLLPDY